MSASAPGDLSAAGVIQRIEDGSYPRAVVETIAQGFLPLPQEELIGVLAWLAAGEDAEIAAQARRSLGEMPMKTVAGFAADERMQPSLLEALSRVSGDTLVLEALIRNRAVSDAAVAALARRAEAAVQEIIVINQARILRAPAILDAILENPRVSAEARRRAIETREEFFEKKAAKVEAADAAALLDSVGEDEILDLPVDAIADLLQKAALEETAGAEPPPPPELLPEERADPVKQSIFSRILTMTVAQKVMLAFKGGKTERMLLIRERNRLICSAVMRNPRMNDNEVEMIAGMRNVDEEVLRLLAMKREWMAKYSIMSSLIRNPKAPIGVVLPLINRLTLRDLKNLKDDKGVSEGVRALARKLFAQKSQKA